MKVSELRVMLANLSGNTWIDFHDIDRGTVYVTGVTVHTEYAGAMYDQVKQRMKISLQLMHDSEQASASK